MFLRIITMDSVLDILMMMRYTNLHFIIVVVVVVAAAAAAAAAVIIIIIIILSVIPC